MKAPCYEHGFVLLIRKVLHDMLTGGKQNSKEWNDLKYVILKSYV